jgi:flagellar hook-associated protein FlgK
LVNNENEIKEDVQKDTQLIQEIQALRTEIASMPKVNMTSPIIPNDTVINRDSILDEIGG